MKVVIVEDDSLQWEQLIYELKLRFVEIKIDLIETELDFRKKVSQLGSEKPDIILMDIMLRWTDPAPQMELPPPEIGSMGFYNAGFRCQKLLSENPKTKDIPVIFMTVLDKVDLEDQMKKLSGSYFYVAKSKDINPLINQMRRILKHRI